MLEPPKSRRRLDNHRKPAGDYDDADELQQVLSGFISEMNRE